MLDRCIVAYLAAPLVDACAFLDGAGTRVEASRRALGLLGWSSADAEARPVMPLYAWAPESLHENDAAGQCLLERLQGVRGIERPRDGALLVLVLGVVQATGKNTLADGLQALPDALSEGLRRFLVDTGCEMGALDELLRSARLAAALRCRSFLHAWHGAMAGHSPSAEKPGLYPDPYDLRFAALGTAPPDRRDTVTLSADAAVHDAQRGVDAWHACLARVSGDGQTHYLQPHAILSSAEGVLVETLERWVDAPWLTADAFLGLAAENGLFDAADISLDIATNFPVFTRHRFIRPGYRIRCAVTADLPRLLELETLCWEHTRSDRATLERRLADHPRGQLVVERDGYVLGALYSQRIDSTEALDGRTAHDVHALHHPQGRLTQLLAVNVDPQAQDQRYGDRLLEHALRLCTVTDGIEGVVGVTLCKRFDPADSETFDAYIRREGERRDPVLAFHFSHGATIVRAIHGYRPQDRRNLTHGVLVSYDLATREDTVRTRASLAGPADAELAAASAAQIRSWLESRVIRFMELEPDAYADNRPFMEMGVDSAGLLALQRELEAAIGTGLPGAFFFEFNTVLKVAARLERQQTDGVTAPDAPTGRPVDDWLHGDDIRPGDIAIVGVACRLPGGADDADGLWRVLQSSHSVIESYPGTRGRWIPGKERAGIDRGGFVRDLEAFDAAFFRVSPAEAQLMDPQQRLVLELAWTCMEDAGIAPQELAGRDVGVFVGASNSDYSRLLQERGIEVEAHLGVASSLAVIANRVSYFFDLCGPSLLLDTACSSSLVALHTAVQSLRRRECSSALVAGVNVICHPDLSLAYHKAGMLAPDGQCKVFDARANGYVRAEGAVVLLLKPAAQAIAEGHHVYGIVKGSAINHGGLASGLTVPNPAKQRELLRAAWNDAGIGAESLSYLEAHGTGTSLGDPIEVQAICTAYAESADPSALASCSIGSVKSHLGHLESAAGLAGVLKVLLAMRYGQLPATINFSSLNPKIELGAALRIQAEPGRWPAGKRYAGISSFGSGGANAHVVIADGVAGSATVVEPAGLHLFVLSATSGERLRAYVERVLAWLETPGHAGSFTAAIQTWQAGRTAMRNRLAMRVSDPVDLVARLRSWLAGTITRDTWTGDGSVEVAPMWRTEAARGLVRSAAQARDLEQLAVLWTSGLDVDWTPLHGERRRIPGLPTYPFARDRHWVDGAAMATAERGAGRPLHPMLHANVSDLAGPAFATVFDGSEPFLADHHVKVGDANEAVLPAVAYMEMMCAALEHATPETARGMVLELRHVAWMAPLWVRGQTALRLRVTPGDEGEVACQIASGDSSRETAHGVGRAGWGAAGEETKIDLPAVRARMQAGGIDHRTLYSRLEALGLVYGPSHRALEQLWLGDGEVLGRLLMPPHLASDAANYWLHPSLADAALQACIGLLAGADGEPRLPFSVDRVRVQRDARDFQPCWVWVRRSAVDRERLDIDLCTNDGRAVVVMQGFSARAIGGRSRDDGVLLAEASWSDSPRATAPAGWGRRQIFTPCWSGNTAGDVLLPVDAASCEMPAWEREETPDVGYAVLAQAAFQRVKDILSSRESVPHLLQVALPDDGESSHWLGLAALFRTANLENPNFHGQVLVVPAAASGAAIAEWAAEMAPLPGHRVLRLESGAWRALDWIERPAVAIAPPYREHGVYLITGGLGALGRVFAEEILTHTGHARVVLCGRGFLSGTRLAELQVLQERWPGRVRYAELDLGDTAGVAAMVGDVLEREGALHGVLHCAGMIRDEFIVRKTAETFREVLAPKVAGTLHLDAATASLPLDFFVLFSSTASAFGHVGQVDYAAANGFMDGFAMRRNARVARGERQGRSIAIHWPLWKDGGMRMEETAQREWQRRTGMRALKRSEGIAAFRQAVATGMERCVVMPGRREALKRTLAATAHVELPLAEPAMTASTATPEELARRTEEFLRSRFSKVLKLPAHQIDAKAPLDTYGIDSILAMRLTAELEKPLGSLPKTLFFEHRSIAELARHLGQTHASTLDHLLAANGEQPLKRASGASGAMPRPPVQTPRRPAVSAELKAVPVASDPIAIVGLSGRYPESPDLGAYWRNLTEGRDCIVEVPAERWDWRDHYSKDRAAPGRHYSRWGGFIEGVDEFDPQFFHIAPREARFIDPQERLFLQHAWMAVEDAGYTRAGLNAGGEVGVYVGVMYSEYQLLGVQAEAAALRMGFAGNVASIANRVSFALDLHGPSMTLDTMCSSSLTAIHVACQDLRQGRTHMALAGGVNVSIHPQKYLLLSAGQFISGDGHCQSFGEGGDGYIPGEGVGAVVLKRLSDAVRDGDHIYGLIRGSALNHGGRTNGYTVPNPQAQATAIGRALSEAGVDARHISYVEAHGTGTRLGDPIEIAALSRAFGAYTNEKQFCLIGSAKSNIGHCEAAAGMAGLTKVLLQMQYRQIVPSLHSTRLNPHIDFPAGPFEVNQALRAWEAPVIDGRTVARVAGLSSFGAGGSNAHMIVEEYADAAAAAAEGPALVVVSARTAGQLRQKVQDLLRYLAAGPASLGSIAYTLQVGREAMNERLALAVRDVAELAARLRGYLDEGETAEGVYAGQVQAHREAVAWLSDDADLRDVVERWLATGKLERIAQAWVRGMDIPWLVLHGSTPPPRVSLPTYPFARERYWLDTGARAGDVGTIGRLHPLLHENVSDLSRQAFRSSFNGNEALLRDHRVRIGVDHVPLMPAAAWLEMARAAVERAVPMQGDAGGTSLQLHDIVWPRPLAVEARTVVELEVRPGDDAGIHVDIVRVNDEARIEHAHMRASFATIATETIELPSLQQRMSETCDVAGLYARLETLGLQYGPSQRTIDSVRRCEEEVLARLVLPDGGVPVAHMAIHPAMLDGAFQACAALLEDDSSQAYLPFAIERVDLAGVCEPDMLAWIRLAPAGDSQTRHFDIDLLDTRGQVRLKIVGLAVRPASAPGMSASSDNEIVALAPVWRTAASASGDAGNDPQVIVLGGSEAKSAALQAVMDGVCRRVALAIAPSAEAIFAGTLAELQRLARGAEAVSVQMLCDAGLGEGVLAGVSGMLRSAAQEHPSWRVQMVVDESGADAFDTLVRGLRVAARSDATTVRLTAGGEVLAATWDRIAAFDDDAPPAFLPGCVYLVTGGLGGLGALFAREAISRGAHVVLSGRHPFDERIAARVADIGEAQDSQLSYAALDLDDAVATRRVVEAILARHGRLDGVLHLAGCHADASLLDKTAKEMARVLLPKVAGTLHLDQATGDVDLQWFGLCSSVAGAFGNAGQVDYAAANGFLDGFARERSRLVASGARRGRTVSIGWPLWADGGMQLSVAQRERLERATGMRPLATPQAMRVFHTLLAAEHSHVAVLSGDRPALERALARAASLPAPRASLQMAAATAGAPGNTRDERAEALLRERLANVLKLPPEAINPSAPLEDYGMDSILAVRFTADLESIFGSLSKTLLYEYRNLRELARYLAGAFPDRLPGVAANVAPAHAASTGGAMSKDRRTPATPLRRLAAQRLSSDRPRERDVAIVGLAGRYPQAEDLQAFWRNLREGLDCITEIPSERWDHARYFDPLGHRPGTSYSKWGGFLAGIDQFDPLLFGISPKEAALLDPQERLFLETAWQVVEDAGYSKASLAGSRTAVYVGVMWGQYELYGHEAIMAGQGVPSSSHASIANRVSYFFDLRGPSMAIDTMCSSSLTAIHMACEEIRRGNIDAAIAGGVNLNVHPHKYLTLSQGRFAATDGRCRSFGAGGDGYVPGEGVGAVLLKSLDQALRDGDHIYGIVRSSALNHGGKTNGYTVPNPSAQAELIEAAFRQGGVEAGSVSYIEAHGTGTALGDPIEITGLTRAFAARGGVRTPCAIGSVKSNIGHLESAAGIAALTKVLLQLRHRQLVPSLHAQTTNPNIDFAQTPFRLQACSEPWQAPGSGVRRAGISSFGAGGANAHLVVEEFRADLLAPVIPLPVALILSARDSAALEQYARRIADALDAAPRSALADIAYTLQVGRTAMDARIAMVADDPGEAAVRLRRWADAQAAATPMAGLAAAPDEGVLTGNANDLPSYAHRLVDGEVGRAFVHQLMAIQDMGKLCRLWILGLEVDWQALHADSPRRRVPLPTYPFQRQRFWIGGVSKDRTPVQTVPMAEPARARLAIRWSPLSAPETIAAAPGGPLLVIDPAGDLHEAMAASHRAAGVAAPMRLALDALQPGRASGAADLADVRNFVNDLARTGRMPSHIVWRADDGTGQAPLLLHLSRALIEAGHACTLVLLAAPRSPAQEALAGFLHSLVQEQPRFRVVTVGFAATPQAREMAGFALAEAAQANHGVREIRYQRAQDGMAWLRFERELFLDDRAESTKGLPLRHAGTYVITGGLGGLGRIFAEYLVRRHAACVVLVGRSALDPDGKRFLDALNEGPGNAVYERGDVALDEDANRIVGAAKRHFGALHGIVHAAGLTRDGAILHKDATDLLDVAAPKIRAAQALDNATRDEALDLFVLFSSLAGIRGNAGQADYAYANRFLDAFAIERERQREEGARQGRTVSIAWPLWAEGRMRIAAPQSERLYRQIGMLPMPADQGIAHFEAILRDDQTVAIPLYGQIERLAASLAPSVAVMPPPRTPVIGSSGDPAAVALALLRRLVGEEIDLAPESIGARERLESFGLDSIAIGRLNARLHDVVGELPQTLFYEHETLAAAASFIARHAPDRLLAMAPPVQGRDAAYVPGEPVEQDVIAKPVSEKAEPAQGKIAIVGLHGRYPGAPDTEAFWRMLADGAEAIGPVPPERWDADACFDADPKAAADGKIYCRHGGFLEEVDRFDPAFFRIPREEALVMDPQERLFLQSVWSAMEDAGYTRGGLRARYPKGKGADVGVFVGTTTQSYAMLSAQAQQQGVMLAPSSMPWSIANRVSYMFDFRGPSVPVDTACSSALVALHMACESLRRGECRVAVVGAVNLYLHASKYLSLCQRGMLARHGATRSFGEGDNGFVPGEGIGSLVLKPLDQALHDGDRIHGVIAATGFEHAGRGNGYSAPNPNAQGDLIRRVLAERSIDPDTIDYVEGHGTGTPMGDDVELRALAQVFGQSTQRRSPLSLGCVKSNIGHLESAAGLSGLTKVLLQFRHGYLAPTLHARADATHVGLADGLVRLQHVGEPWQEPAGRPRRALVNAFGAGGVNACVVLEQAPVTAAPVLPDAPLPQIFALSATSEERLRVYAERFASYLEARADGIDLGAVCATLQHGRESFATRLAVVVQTAAEAAGQLRAWLAGEQSRVVTGVATARHSAPAAASSAPDEPALQMGMDWVAGRRVAWDSRVTAPPLDLPTYPFAGERFWIVPESRALSPSRSRPAEERLHPWVSYNASTLHRVCFDSWLSTSDSAAFRHPAEGQPMLAPPTLLEIAVACGTLAGEQSIGGLRDVRIDDALRGEKDLHLIRTVLEPSARGIAFRLESPGECAEQPLGKGLLVSGRPVPATEGQHDLRELRRRCMGIAPGDVAARLKVRGYRDGDRPGLIGNLHVCGDFALARLDLAADGAERGNFLLQPDLLEGLFRTAVLLLDRDVPGTDAALSGFDALSMHRGLPTACHALVAWAERDAAAPRMDAWLLDEEGVPIVTVRGLAMRPVANAHKAQAIGSGAEALN